MSDVLYEQNGKTAVITLNRAAKLNALNEALIQGLRTAL